MDDMSMNTTNPKVDSFMINAQKWRTEMEVLRAIVLSCPLAENVKWGAPCYSLNNSNVVLIHGFKEYCALLFFKGALLKDSNNLLIQQTEHVQASRQIRFTHVQSILEMEPILKNYILEAIEIEKLGFQVELKKSSELNLPEELQHKFKEEPEFEAAFERLTPGRRRAYIIHFTAPKQSKTRVSRIEKCVSAIMNGKGLNE